MRNKEPSAFSSLRRLLRFLLVYGLLLGGLLWLLPAAGQFLEARYDALDSAARFALITLLLLIAVGWQLVTLRNASREHRLAAKSAEAPRNPTRN